MGGAQCEKHFIREPLDIEGHAAEAHRVELLGQLKKRRADIIYRGVRDDPERGSWITREAILHRSKKGTRARFIERRHRYIVTSCRKLHHGCTLLRYIHLDLLVFQASRGVTCATHSTECNAAVSSTRRIPEQACDGMAAHSTLAVRS